MPAIFFGKSGHHAGLVYRQGDSKVPVMLQAEDLAPDFPRDSFGSMSAKITPGSVPASARTIAHGIHNQAVTIGFAAILVTAALCRCDHKSAVFNRPGPQQHMPVRLAGGNREGGRYGKRESASLRQTAIKRRETAGRSRPTGPACPIRYRRAPRNLRPPRCLIRDSFRRFRQDPRRKDGFAVARGPE